MTFDQWWDTLTIKEQTVIGKNNARFVWGQACEACAQACEDEIKLVKPIYSVVAENVLKAIRQLGESK